MRFVDQNLSELEYSKEITMFSLEYILMASYATSLYPSAMAHPKSVSPMIETTVSVCSRNNGEMFKLRNYQ